MNQNNRFCIQEGHKQLLVYRVCTYKWCKRNRWCCSKCMRDKIHKHSIPYWNHIMNQAQLLSKVKQDIQNLQKEYLDSKQVNNIQAFLQQQVNQISDEDNLKLQQLIQKVEGQNFMQLNDEDINKLLNINQYQFNCDIQLQFQDKEQNVKQYQENKNNNLIDIKSMKYDIQEIHQYYDDNLICSSVISKNEQYLVYNVQNLLYIYSLKMNKIYKTLQQQRILTTFQFTTNSKILFASDFAGFVNGYFVQQGFKIFYKQKIHQNKITQLLAQKQFLITASDDATIIKTNFIQKNQIFKLIGHNHGVISIDYNVLKDILISTSFDATLKIWDCLSQSTLIKHKLIKYNLSSLSCYGQIQLINNKQDILMGFSASIKKFEIDYQNKKLVETQSYNLESGIQRFQSINNDQNLLLIYYQYCKILNYEGEQIQIQHNSQFIYSQQIIFNLLVSKYRTFTYRQQLENLNYIILQDGKLLQQKQEYTLSLLRIKDKN